MLRFKKIFSPKNGALYSQRCFFVQKLNHSTGFYVKAALFLPKVGENGRELAKMAESWRNWPKVGETGQKSAKNGENGRKLAKIGEFRRKQCSQH
jgi:hypothetical protein